MSIANCIQTIQQAILDAELSCERKPGSVQLLAVSKGQSSLNIEQAAAAGLQHFGENYIQEALIKITSLKKLPLIWHFIGAIQSNKAQAIAEHFSWVHGVDRKKIALLLNATRPSSMPALNVCIQVNMDHSKTKSGVLPECVAELATEINLLPQLRLRGLMVIPDETSDNALLHQTYTRTQALLTSLNAQLHLNMDTLSMGMSNDLNTAICAGSTIVRVGRGIFGNRIKQ